MMRIATLLPFVWLLMGGVAYPQSATPVSPSQHAPGWDDFQELRERLEAVEAENQKLKDGFYDASVEPVSMSQQAGFCESCGEMGCDCSWVSQLSVACKEGLSWNKGRFRIVPYGYFAADMIASEKAYAILGGPLFLLPGVPADIPDERFNLSAQQTTIGLNVSGPNLGYFQSSANVAVNFFGDRPVFNNPGVFFVLGYVELKNENWRFWAGQDPDSIGRQNTNSPAWTTHKQSGNYGQIRPGFRAERFFHLGENASSSLYFGLTQQVVLDFIANPEVAGTDNGWPNIESRWAINLGPECHGQRPLMFAIGGIIGETRAVDFAGRPLANVSTSWAVIPELQLKLGRWGFQGEAFAGDAIGTYNAAIGQSLNLVTDEPIYTFGGFGELFCEITPYLTLAAGYGIDNPRDSDLAPTQRASNETYWVNAILRCSEQWETRFEIARQETDWIAPSLSSRAMEYLVSVRYYF